MRNIPCKLCNVCGLYHNATVLTCSCGADLSNAPALPVDLSIPIEQCGRVDSSLPVYVQKCSACGTEHFTADPANRVKVCRSCHKTRIASVEPVLYVPEETIPAEVHTENTKDIDEDRDDDDVGSWTALLEATVHPVPSELTLAAIRYGKMAITLKADQTNLPFLLGRSANCADFLQNDLRVSNEHCYLTFQGGSWIVIDHHSANGTAVNGQFLDCDGQKELCDGDELTLGHHPDSMAFRITIR